MGSHYLSGRQVVYTRLEFGSRLLWDESSKKMFIDAFLDEKKNLGAEVYAFAVFSEQFYMLTGRFGAYTEHEAYLDHLGALDRFLAAGLIPEADMVRFREGTGLRFSVCCLSGIENILKVLMYIHLAARNLGYVRAGFDYWWSSVQTYRNRYSWSCLCTQVIYENLSPDPERARRSLVRRHREQERSGNPAPECIHYPVIYSESGSGIQPLEDRRFRALSSM